MRSKRPEAMDTERTFLQVRELLGLEVEELRLGDAYGDDDQLLILEDVGIDEGADLEYARLLELLEPGAHRSLGDARARRAIVLLGT